MKTYSAVSESGSWSQDENGNVTGREEKRHCGHKHRSIEAAEKCLMKKMDDPDYYFTGTIHDENQMRVSR